MGKSDKCWIRLFAAAFGFLIPSLSAQTSRPLQSWLTSGISQRYDYGLEFLMETEQRFSTGKQIYQRYELTPQAIWHYSPRYDFSLGYEESRQWADDGDDSGGHEGLASVSLKFPFKEWLLVSRQRLQGGMNDNSEASLVFRQQTRLCYEGPRFPFHLQPYLQDEWFVDLINGQSLTENRAQAGLAYVINRSWRAEIYGMAHSEWSGSGKSSITPVIGFNLNLAF